MTAGQLAKKRILRVSMKVLEIMGKLYFIVYFTVYLLGKHTKDFIVCQVFF